MILTVVNSFPGPFVIPDSTHRTSERKRHTGFLRGTVGGVGGPDFTYMEGVRGPGGPYLSEGWRTHPRRTPEVEG